MNRTAQLLIFILLHGATSVNAQSVPSLDSIQAPAGFENIHTVPVHSDSLSSSFVIFIRKEVKLHKHVYHTEQVLILEGEGLMRLGEKSFAVKKGDIILIPKNTPHALRVSGNIPVKVLSIQAPFFDGKDRISLE